MPFTIKANDTSGIVILHRDTVPAALKKASELTLDGCWDVEITTPEGTTVYADGAADRPFAAAPPREPAN